MFRCCRKRKPIIEQEMQIVFSTMDFKEKYNVIHTSRPTPANTPIAKGVWIDRSDPPLVDLNESVFEFNRAPVIPDY